mmetsp:Transcript_12260/g.13553  ORF Transcript_12260/g.13553 Transcript_12260/m.13553 type:complete len:146 (-) Transcript_12260:401-838(-)
MSYQQGRNINSINSINSHTITPSPSYCTVLLSSNLDVPNYNEVTVSTSSGLSDGSNGNGEPVVPFDLFEIKYDPLLTKFFGKNPRPVLYALCMTIVLKLGVIPVNEGRYYQVVNHDAFMLSISIFSMDKTKTSTSAYSTYRSIAR